MLPFGNQVFNVKYGLNELTIPIPDDYEPINSKDRGLKEIKIKFRVKYGTTVIFLPIKYVGKDKFTYGGLTDLFTKKATVYIDIPATAAQPRTFDRRVVDKCAIQGAFVNKSNGATVQNIVNAQTLITKDTERYKEPLEYMQTPADERVPYYTVKVGDYIVFDEVDDEVTNAQEFARLKAKYKEQGITVTSVSASLNGMAVDNICVTNA